MCNFRVGQKVVCVDPAVQHVWKKDVPYTVHSVGVCSKCGEVHILIEETFDSRVGIFNCTFCDNIIPFTSMNTGTDAKAFRPIITDYTEEELASVDISPLIEELELETV